MANTDLQQFNGTQAFPSTADVGTNADQFLIPTDGPLITADSNLLNQAPANPAWQRLKNYYLGLRAATIGDFMGAVRKTFKSLHVDGTGGATSALAPGQIEALDSITTTAGDLIATTGGATTNQSIRSENGLLISGTAGSEESLQGSADYRYVGTTTGSGGANPPQGTSIKNQLRAKNIPKVSAYINMSGAGTFASYDGYGVSGVSVVAAGPGGGNGIKVDFVDAMDNTNFTAIATVQYNGAAEFVTEDLALRTTSSCTFYFYNSVVTGGQLQRTDPAAAAVNFSVRVTGQQTT